MNDWHFLYTGCPKHTGYAMRLELVRVINKPKDYNLNWVIIPGSLYIDDVHQWSVYDIETGVSYYLHERDDDSVMGRVHRLIINERVYMLVLAADRVILCSYGMNVAAIKVPVAGNGNLWFNVDRNGHVHIVFGECIIELAVHN